MKKLFLHIGYPKTGTKYMQKIFYQNKNLNYMGSMEERDSKTKIIDNLINDLLIGKLKNKEFYKKELNKVLLENKLNIYSNEGILAPHYYNRKIEFKENLNCIKEIFFDQGFKIKLIITIRNQIELLQSYIAEDYYDHFYHIDLDNIFSEKKLEHVLKSLKYGEIIDLLSNFTNKEDILILKYESLSNNTSQFHNEINSFFGEKIFNELSNQSHINKSFKNKEITFAKLKYVIARYTNKLNNYLFYRILKKIFFLKFLKKVYLHFDMVFNLSSFFHKMLAKKIKFNDSTKLEISKYYSRHKVDDVINNFKV